VVIIKTTKSAEVVGPAVIVIDENGLDDGHESNREKFVQAIAEEIPALPPSIKVLITSRDEGKISLLMPDCSSCLSMRMEELLYTDEDILRYIRHRMVRIRRTLPGPLDNRPGATREMELAQYADGLFIWANIVCAFLESGGDNPDVQLVKLGSNSREGVKAKENLDLLYLDVLRCSRPEDEGIPAHNWQYVVDSLAAPKTPLTYRNMGSVLSLSVELLIAGVDGLSKRVHANIPEALRYACRHFAGHLNDIFSPLPVLRADLEIFVTNNLLHWIEVMGILNQIVEAEGCLRIRVDYMKVNP
jgi:hypothetical protein